MADRYDPKLSVRPMTDRKAADARPAQPDADDPLFELAKIVSGRAGVSAPPPARSRTIPAAEPATSVNEQPDVLGDLEAELLSDLQASFAAVKEAVAAPPLVPVPPPASSLPPKPSEPAMRAAPPAPTAPPSPPPPQPSRFAAARPPLQQAPAPQSSAAPPVQAARPVAPPRPAGAPENHVDIANLQLRPTVPAPARPTVSSPAPAAEPAAPALREKLSRWEKPPEPPKPLAGAASRFAPPRAAAPTPPVAPLPAGESLDELPFGDGPPFAMQAEPQEEEEFPLDGFDMVPGLGDEEQIPPYPEEDLAGLGRRRVPRGLMILAGVLVIGLIGGVSVMIFRPGAGGNTTPPIITADASPTKVAPPESAAASDADKQNKLIYDRVDSRGSGATADTKLVTPGSEPLASVPAAGTDNPISRVILPGGPVDHKPAAGATQPPAGEAETAADGADSQSIGPRKVRTVVVKPDGTIVSSEAAPAAAAAPGAATGAAASAQPAGADPPVLPRAQNDDTAAIAGQPGGQELAITPVPGTATSAPPAAAPAHPQPAVPVVRNDPLAAKVVQPQPQAKVVANGGPIDLTPARPVARPPGQVQAAVPPAAAAAAPQSPAQAAPVVNGGMLVQVSSQRSEDAARATFRDLQARYPMLASYQPNIQRADLGDRGVYYRVRVGPLAGSDAQRLCDALKGAGGDCVLAPR